jgi:hypothetical protein
VREAANSCKSGESILYRERPHIKSRNFLYLSLDQIYGIKRYQQLFRENVPLTYGVGPRLGVCTLYRLPQQPPGRVAVPFLRQPSKQWLGSLIPLDGALATLFIGHDCAGLF